eukprot:110156-Hanusia_phi.AAC.2
MEFMLMNMRRVVGNIVSLCICHQDMAKKLAEELADVLPAMTKLQHLRLGYNQLRSEEIARIARGLKEVMGRLETLDLEGNAMGPEGPALCLLSSLKMLRYRSASTCRSERVGDALVAQDPPPAQASEYELESTEMR